MDWKEDIEGEALVSGTLYRYGLRSPLESVDGSQLGGYGQTHKLVKQSTCIQ